MNLFVFLTFVSAAQAIDYVELLTPLFSEEARNEMQSLMTLAEEKPELVFSKCPADVKPRSRCFPTPTLSFSEKIIDILKEPKSKCIQPSNATLELITTLAYKFGDDVANEIIRKRAEKCGRTCNRRLSCCNGEDNFFLQGAASQPCGRVACEIEALNATEMKQLDVQRPCDFAQAGFTGWQTLNVFAGLFSDNVHRVTQQLMCGVFGTKRPRLNCVPTPNSAELCHCCCHDHKPVNRLCVPIKDSNDCP